MRNNVESGFRLFPRNTGYCECKSSDIYFLLQIFCVCLLRLESCLLKSTRLSSKSAASVADWYMILVLGLSGLQLGCEAVKQLDQCSLFNWLISSSWCWSDSDQLTRDTRCRGLVFDDVWGGINALLFCVSAQAVFARGISAVWQNYICVGRYSLTHLMAELQTKDIRPHTNKWMQEGGVGCVSIWSQHAGHLADLS